MTLWFLNGIKKGIKTEKNPDESMFKPDYPSVLEGKSSYDCPTGAISNGTWIKEKCIFCGRCDLRPTGNQNIYNIHGKMPEIFKRSFYLYPIDSGTCGACNAEFKSIFSPQYDANRFNIFEAETPRHADALLIMGVYTNGMEKIIEEAYNAMPDPKIVIAMGACTLSGGIIGSGINKKFNVEIAGCPPTPYSIISAILRYRGD